MICGLGWTIAYISMVQLGVKHRTYGVPLLGLTFNFSWEVYNTIQGYLAAGFHVTTIINIAWSLVDAGIVLTYLKYGKEENNPLKFYGQFILVLLLFFVVQNLAGAYFGPVRGALYTGNLFNVVLSLAYILMLQRRGSRKGQSMLIAYSKMIGTLAVTILVGGVGVNVGGGPIRWVLFAGFASLVLDIAYIYLLGKAPCFEPQNISPKKVKAETQPAESFKSEVI